jgi:hypothetical protein
MELVPIWRARSNALSAAASTGGPESASARPAAVRCTSRDARSSSATPRSDSSWRIVLDTICCCQVQDLGRAREAQLFGHGEKRPDLTQVRHASLAAMT